MKLRECIEMYLIFYLNVPQCYYRALGIYHVLSLLVSPSTKKTKIVLVDTAIKVAPLLTMICPALWFNLL